MSRIRFFLLTGVVSAISMAVAVSGGVSAAATSFSKGASASVLTQVKQEVAAEEKPPHPIVLPTLTKRPPKGVKVGLVTCPLPECQAVVESAQQAAKLLGWKLTVYQGGLEPATTISATQDAVQAKPAAVIDIAAFPSSVIAAPLALASKLHVPVVDIASTDAPSGPIIADSGANHESIYLESAAMAHWIIADSNGKANVLAYADNGVQSQALPAQVVQQVLKKQCPHCSLTIQQVNIADTSSEFQGQVVSYLQQHPGYQYVVLPDGTDAAGLGVAIKAAGVPLPKIVSRVDTPQNFTDIENGTEAVAVTEELDAMAWRAFDVIARRLVGDPISSCCVEPVTQYQILTKANIKNPSEPWTVPDLPQTFAKVWRVS